MRIKENHKIQMNMNIVINLWWESKKKSSRVAVRLLVLYRTSIAFIIAFVDVDVDVCWLSF